MIIPRGRISHTIFQSLKYIFMALFQSLKEKNIISKFESEFAKYIGTKKCIAFPHARTALYFLLKELNLPEGSKILMPTLTIKFILDVVVSLGLKPCYVDYDLETYSFGIEDLKKLEDPEIKVMLLTPIFGIVPDMGEIKKYCDDRNIFLIEDFSQCLNGKYNKNKIGSFGNASIYSASSIKTLDTLGGGLLVTDNEDLYKNLKYKQEKLDSPKRFLLLKRAFINFARNIVTHPLVFNLVTIYLIRLISNMNKENSLRQTGTRNKKRLHKLPHEWFVSYSSVQAKIGLENIHKVILGDRKRRECANYYIEKIGSEYFAQGAKNSTNVFWQLPIKTENAKLFHDHLRIQGVDSALTSLQLICSLKEYPGHKNLSNSEMIFNNGLFIPCYAHLKRVEYKKVSRACINSINHISNLI